MGGLDGFSPVQEDTVLRSLGTGYLKVPDGVRKAAAGSLGEDVTKWPTPTVDFKVNPRGDLTIRYHFTKGE